MAAVLLKPHGAPPDALTRVMDAILGGFFRGFNRFFKWSAEKYRNAVQRLLNWKSIALILYAGLVGLTVFMFIHVPTGYVPPQDKAYLIAFAQLPDGASLDRTEAVIKRMADMIDKTPGVDHAVEFSGLSVNGFTVSSNAGIIFVTLKPFDERRGQDLSANGIVKNLTGQFGSIKDAFVMILSPPPVQGLGTAGGFKLQIEDHADLGNAALFNAVQAVTGKAYGMPNLLTGVFSGYQINVPELYVDINRTRAEQLGIPVSTIFSTLQIYLGSLYINDFNRFNRTYQVTAQADANFRSHSEDISRLQVRNNTGSMVPMGSVLNVTQSYGPERAMRYNGFRTADINGNAPPGVSSSEAQATITKILNETLPKGMGFEWTDLTYQQILAGDSSLYVFPLCVLLVFLVLAAQYESLSLPLAVILIVPMSLLCAISGVWADHGDNNIFTQIGFIVLVGLACKNAILIVEFAREMEIGGATPVEAALEAVRMRLRPILMTSFAFVMGVVPLVTSFGAGSEMRHAMGIAVFCGMLGVTFFGLFLTPIFYVVLRTLFPSRLETAGDLSIHTHSHTEEGDHVQH